MDEFATFEYISTHIEEPLPIGKIGDEYATKSEIISEYNAIAKPPEFPNLDLYASDEFVMKQDIAKIRLTYFVDIADNPGGTISFIYGGITYTSVNTPVEIPRATTITATASGSTADKIVWSNGQSGASTTFVTDNDILITADYYKLSLDRSVVELSPVAQTTLVSGVVLSTKNGVQTDYYSLEDIAWLSISNSGPNLSFTTHTNVDENKSTPQRSGVVSITQDYSGLVAQLTVIQLACTYVYTFEPQVSGGIQISYGSLYVLDDVFTSERAVYHGTVQIRVDSVPYTHLVSSTTPGWVDIVDGTLEVSAWSQINSGIVYRYAYITATQIQYDVSPLEIINYTIRQQSQQEFYSYRFILNSSSTLFVTRDAGNSAYNITSERRRTLNGVQDPTWSSASYSPKSGNPSWLSTSSGSIRWTRNWNVQRIGNYVFVQAGSLYEISIAVVQDIGREVHFFYTAGPHTFIVPSGVTSIDVFLVGGGASGRSAALAAGAGGGGGYTTTYKANNLAPYGWSKNGGSLVTNSGDSISIVVGAGGTQGGNNGGNTTLLLGGTTYTAEGGKVSTGSLNYRLGGDGGSGGGGRSNSPGSDGGNGNASSGNDKGGTGQGHTTRPFAEDETWTYGLGLPKAVDVPYAGGGAGYGGGDGGWYGGGSSRLDGTDGFGGGGGGGAGAGQYGGIGGCGCVIIRIGEF